jgi:hypothetical protein
MAEKLRREKDIVQRNVNKYLEATTSDYTRYFEGGPTYITYYQLASEVSKQDSSLENVHSLIGANTPNKYKKIEDVVVYAVDQLDVLSSIEEKGAVDSVTGEFVFLPDSVRPFPGDFFTFDYDGLRDHLFRINDVQYDKASPKKFFKISFALYPENSELIMSNITKDGSGNDITYVMQYDSIGTAEASVITKADSVAADALKKMSDAYVEKYINLFYDEDMDAFIHYENETYEVDGETLAREVGYWSPYLQKFMHNNRILEKFAKEILTEIYIYEITQGSFPDVFSDAAYRNSIYRKIETQDKNLNFYNNFMGVSPYNVMETRNLPFFHNPNQYRVLNLHKDASFNFDAFDFIYGKPSERIIPLNPDYTFPSEDPEGFIRQDFHKEGDLVYEVPLNLNFPVGVYRIRNDGDLDDSLDSINLSHIVNGSNEDIPVINITNDLLLTTIKKYLDGTLKISDLSITVLNNFYMEQNIKDYTLVPIFIYILKKLIAGAV